MVTQRIDERHGLLWERLRGDSFHTIRERHNLPSYEAAQMAVVREGTKHVTKIELELMVCRKTGDQYGLAVPNQAQDDRALALNYFTWVLAQLRKRDIQVKVINYPTPEGIVLFLEDVTDYGGTA